MKIPKVPLLIILILALLYFRIFHWLVHAWLTDPYYSHGFLVIIISGFIAWRALRAARAHDGLNSQELIARFSPALHGTSCSVSRPTGYLVYLRQS
jgi:hypothetical protein